MIGEGSYILRLERVETALDESIEPLPEPEPEEPEPELGTGDVQITLRWDSKADLDLHVIDPDGEEIYYNNSRADSGGELDVDSNDSCDNATSSPVENVYWPSGDAPFGEYVVIVDYYDDPCGLGLGDQDFEVEVRTDGEVLETITGRLSYDEEEEVFSFTYGGAGASSSSGSSSDTVDLALRNESSVDICSVLIGTPGSEWSGDLLDSVETSLFFAGKLMSRSILVVEVTPGEWALRAEDCNGNEVAYEAAYDITEDTDWLIR